MSAAWDEPASLSQVDALATAGLPEAAVDRAVDLLAAPPSPAVWARHLDRLLLGLGSALLVAAVVYGVAWNWSELGELTRLAGLQVVFAAVGAVAVWRGPGTAGGRAAALAAAALVGPLLALIGITWQTGADPWTLFAAWAALAAPMVAGAGSAWGWVGWVLVVDVAVGLWIGQASGWPLDTAPLVAVAALAALHAVAGAALLGAGRVGLVSPPAGAVGVLLGMALVNLTGPAMVIAMGMDVGGGWMVFDAALWAVAVAVHAGLLVVHRSVAAGAAGGLSLLAVVTMAFWRVALEIDDGPLMWFVCGVFVLGGAIGLAAGIRAVARRGAA